MRWPVAPTSRVKWEGRSLVPRPDARLDKMVLDMVWRAKRRRRGENRRVKVPELRRAARRPPLPAAADRREIHRRASLATAMAVAGVSRECRNNIKDFASREGLRMCAEGERVICADNTLTPDWRSRRCEVPGAWRIYLDLHYAAVPNSIYTVALNDAEILRLRLSRGDAELRRNLTEKGDDSALIWAAIAGAVDSVRFLVERFGVAVDPVCGGRSLLHTAARWGRTAMCRYLVQRGADPRLSVDSGCTVLHFASSSNPDTLRYFLLEAGCRDMVNWADMDGTRPLTDTVGQSHLQCAIELLACGANVNFRDSDRATALHVASMVGAEVPMVTLLLDAGCNPAARDASGMTPADYARIDGDDIASRLRRAHRAETLALLARGTPAQQAKNRGIRHAQSRRWAEAEAAYTESVEANTAPAVQGRTGKLRREALTNRALMRIHLGRWADALADCDAALELDPDNVKALTRRAKCRRELGDEAGAREDAALVVRLDPREKSAVEAIAGLTL